MVWNIAPECISTVVLSIIWIYSRKGSIAPSLKNKLFQLCFLVTFLAMTTNIVSTLLIYNLSSYTLVLAWITNTIYFITTPLMGMIYYLYVMANLYDHRGVPKGTLFIMLIPAFIYIGMVIVNPWTHAIYSLTLENGYQTGTWIASTYIIFYLYCMIAVIAVIWKGKYVEKTVRTILFSFPLIAAIVIIFQQAFPEIVLSGSAATIALLMIYLYMQNKQIAIDYLTKLPNRQEFLNLIDWSIQTKVDSFSIVIVSLREFKRINDVYGQYAGDAFLQAIGEYLKKEFSLNRRQLFRYSGDEFAILIEDANPAHIEDILQRISKRMMSPWNLDSYNCVLYVALGVVQYPSCADTKEEIINGIEFSINVAKKDTAAHHICYCTQDVLNKVKRRQQVSEALHECLKKRSFAVHYQPIYSLDTKKFSSAEALLRIPDSMIGAIYPDEFIPVAEESGLLIDITYYVLDEVCHILQETKDLQIPMESISVNFSTSQFLQPDLMERVISILNEHNIDGSMIKIEITESTLSENADAMMAYARMMNTHGIRLSLDDFGTGYSNTTSVLTFPIDTIKLDKSLIWSAMKNDRSAMVVRNLSRTFKDLGFVVLAEGVETLEQSDFVEECGCSLIQGYYYAKPIAKEAFIKFMKEHL
ncbi:putative bifunctional diguanylate cyclase/phosphodiesterase [Amedibacillus sp. YH-ame10]